MDTIVVRITPRRIERVVLLAVIIFFILTTIYYANKYYETTEEDEGYLDQIFSGTFFAKVPTEEEVHSIVDIIEENGNEGNLSEIELAGNLSSQNNESINESQNCNDDGDCGESEVCDDGECVAAPEPESCDRNDLTLLNFSTTKLSDTESRRGTVNDIKLSFCNTDSDVENFMIAEVFIWDRLDIEEKNTGARQMTPRRTVDTITPKLAEGETYIRTYDFTPAISIYRDARFFYIIKFFNADSDGVKLSDIHVKEVAGSHEFV